MTCNDPVLCFLGTTVGASTVQPDHLKFLFELSEDFCTLPSYGVILGQKGMVQLLMGGVPGLEGIDVTKVSSNQLETKYSACLGTLHVCILTDCTEIHEWLRASIDSVCMFVLFYS